MVPNIKQATLWRYGLWSELDAQIVGECHVCMSATWNIGFPTNDKRGKLLEFKKNHVNLLIYF